MNQMPHAEESRQDPATLHGSMKLACEIMTGENRKAYGLSFIVMHYFYPSGADAEGKFGENRQDESHLIPLVLQTAIGRRKTVLVFGDDWSTRGGTCVRNCVHVEDIAQAHVLAVESRRPGRGRGRACNIGSSQGGTVMEDIAACEKLVERPIPWEPAPRRPGDPAVLVASSDRVRQDLGWKPRLEGIEQIAKTANQGHCRYPYGYPDKVQ